MKLSFKIVLFFILYSVGFYYFRTSGYYNYRFLVADIGAIPWLYSSIGTIFGIISAFIIQKEWQQWNDLVDSVKGESSALYDLWLWSERLDSDSKEKIQTAVEEYLRIIVSEGWDKTEQGEISDKLERAMLKINNAVSDLNQTNLVLSSIAFSLFSNIMEFREKRLRHGSSHMPKILRNTFRLATILMIVLCPLIAVRATELHFIFSSSIALLSYTIYVVATDLDNPLRPGGWHLTTTDYTRVLNKLQDNI